MFKVRVKGLDSRNNKLSFLPFCSRTKYIHIQEATQKQRKSGNYVNPPLGSSSSCSSRRPKWRVENVEGIDCGREYPVTGVFVSQL